MLRKLLEAIHKALESYLYDDTYQELENKYYRLLEEYENGK